MTLRALIVDDEPLARQRIRDLLAGEPGIHVVGEAGDGESALARIEADRPDLVFLDVQMPEMTGFEVLEALGPGALPAVVFVTAFDEHAIRAFDAHAVDYLLKPVRQDRFARAVQRVREIVALRRGGQVDERLRALLESAPRARKYAERFVVRTGTRIRFVRAADVDWLEADGNYVRLHTGATSHLVRAPFGRVVETLDPERFVRIHRSHAVNVDRVREVQPYGRAVYLLVLEDGTKLTSSGTYRQNLDVLLGDPF